jgi:hypothetical protein
MFRLAFAAIFLIGCIATLAYYGFNGLYAYIGTGSGIIGIATVGEQVLLRIAARQDTM